MIPVEANAAGMTAAVSALRADQVVAYPTETVYGLAVNPFSERALDALFAAKEREAGKPVLLIVDNAEQAEGLAASWPEAAVRCMERFWPGPLSLLFPAAPGLPARIADDRGHVCIRCPAHETARALCRAWNGPLTSTSANLAGKPPARTADDAALAGVALVLDGGTLNSSVPSTVFDPVTGQILREGPITAAMLKSVGVV